jgi:hypothetical protein
VKFYAEVNIVPEPAHELTQVQTKPLLSGYLRNNLNSVKSVSEILNSSIVANKELKTENSMDQQLFAKGQSQLSDALNIRSVDVSDY